MEAEGGPLIVLVWKDTGRSAETSGEPDARRGGPLEEKKKGTTQLWAWPVSGQLTSDWFWELIKAASGSLSNLSLRLSPQI